MKAEKALEGITATVMILQIQGGKQTPNKINSKQFTPRYIIVKLLKTEDRENLRSSHGK